MPLDVNAIVLHVTVVSIVITKTLRLVLCNGLRYCMSSQRTKLMSMSASRFWFEGCRSVPNVDIIPCGVRPTHSCSCSVQGPQGRSVVRFFSSTVGCLWLVIPCIIRNVIDMDVGILIYPRQARSMSMLSS